jgi:hypothetical protein
MPEIFRYRRREEVRIYSLRVVTGGTELWRVTVRPGQPDAEIKEEDFTNQDVALQYFEEVERALIAGGWREVGE